MLSLGLAVITAFPCPSSCAAAKRAWTPANTVLSISITSVSGWKFVMVSWPKLAANTKASPALVLIAAGDADIACVIGLPCVESPAGSGVLVAGLLATTVPVIGAGDGSAAE